ncbi:peptidoglycan bridge formation glycyltransferase FemA/FemB family protein [Nostoc linckia FACHB-104]|nr:peptidoglycan bridge formation glycyltransferase FemA/FemB family protein [Nostoc linckia FACHB-104]
MNIQVIDLASNYWREILQNIKHDFYQIPEYFALEAMRNKAVAEAILISENDKVLFAPYLLRNCDDLGVETSIPIASLDIVSPYGYPGILLSEAAKITPSFVETAIKKLNIVLKEKGVCSAFFRLHPIINHNLDDILPNKNIFTVNGKTVYINLHLSEEQIWYQTKRDRRKKINYCLQAGLTARMVNFDEYIDKFTEIYQETMQRVAAAKIYYSFNAQYFKKMQEVLKEKLHLCIVEVDHEVASAGLYTEYGGIVQSVFRGTSSKFIALSPGSLEINYVRFWAKQRGNHIFHLGGGLGGATTSLYNFKASFSKLRHNFLTMRLILDEDKYFELVNLQAKALNIDFKTILNYDFFPAYRYQEA